MRRNSETRRLLDFMVLRWFTDMSAGPHIIYFMGFVGEPMRVHNVALEVMRQSTN